MSFSSIFSKIEVNQDESGLFYIFVNIFNVRLRKDSWVLYLLRTQHVVVIDKHADSQPHTDVYSNWKTEAYLNSTLSQ